MLLGGYRLTSEPESSDPITWLGGEFSKCDSCYEYGVGGMDRFNGYSAVHQQLLNVSLD
jgi:hypothetical protein